MGWWDLRSLNASRSTLCAAHSMNANLDITSPSPAIQSQPNPNEDNRRELVKQIGNIFSEIQEFKSYLTKYNQQLSTELVQRRDLGCYLQLLGSERKKSHFNFIERVKKVSLRQMKANWIGGGQMPKNAFLFTSKCIINL